MNFDELQRKMQLAKSANKAVSYKSRSAEDILDKFKSLNSGWVLTLSDKIKSAGDSLIFVSTAICQKGDEKYEGSHEQPVTSSPNKMMSPPQYQGAVSSYARKYALQGLFAMGESDFDQMEQSLLKEGTPAPKQGSTYTMAELGELVKSGTMTRDQANAYVKQHNLK